MGDTTKKADPNVSVKPKRAKKGDYSPFQSPFDTKYLSLYDATLLTFDLRYASLRDLATLINHFQATQSGLKPYQLLTFYSKQRSSSSTHYRALRARLDKLKKKGLVYSNEALYYPTESALKEFLILSKSA